jgi:hypothetical protein
VPGAFLKTKKSFIITPMKAAVEQWRDIGFHDADRTARFARSDLPIAA